MILSLFFFPFPHLQPQVGQEASGFGCSGTATQVGHTVKDCKTPGFEP